MIRAKFKVANKVKEAWKASDGTDVFTVTLYPVVGGSSENDAFFAATPGGQLQLSVVREGTADMFDTGDEFFVDLTPCAFARAQPTSRFAEHG